MMGLEDLVAEFRLVKLNFKNRVLGHCIVEFHRYRAFLLGSQWTSKTSRLVSLTLSGGTSDPADRSKVMLPVLVSSASTAAVNGAQGCKQQTQLGAVLYTRRRTTQLIWTHLCPLCREL